MNKPVFTLDVKSIKHTVELGLMTSKLQIKQSKLLTYLYLNFTLYIVFDVFIRQLTLLNETKQLIANK